MPGTSFLASFGITKAPRTEGWDFSTEPNKPQGGLGSQQMEAASHRQRAGHDPRGSPVTIPPTGPSSG